MSDSAKNNVDENYLELMELINGFEDSIDKKLSQSVMDIANCFICLSQTTNPLSCPKCYNFACELCFKKYFNGDIVKQCPLCKQDIKFSQLKENKIISLIEDILNQNDSKNSKIEKLSKVIEEKRKIWEEQTKIYNNDLDTITKYKDALKKYKEIYISFFELLIKNIINEFDSYLEKIDKLIQKILSLKKFTIEAVKKYDEIKNHNIENYYNNNNEKELINEIIYIEKKHFEDINISGLQLNFKFIPYLYKTRIKETVIRKSDLSSCLITKGNNKVLGEFSLKYNYDTRNGYKIGSLFSFKNNICKNPYFLVIQKTCIKNYELSYSMNLARIADKKYIYRNDISLNEFDKGEADEITIKIDVIIFRNLYN